MLTTDELKKITSEIKNLESHVIDRPLEFSRLNGELKFDKKEDYLRVISLYKKLVDEGYPTHSQILRVVEEHLLLDEAMCIETKYFHENDVQAKNEHSEMLVRLANVVYGCGECIDELLDFDCGEEVNHQAEQAYRFEKALELLKKANAVLETPETYCLIGELFFDMRDYDSAEQYFKKSVIKDRNYAKAYVNQSRLLEKKYCADTAIRFLQDALNEGVESVELRILLIELCKGELDGKKNTAQKVAYLTIAREQYGIVKDKIALYGSSILFDEPSDKKDSND